MRDKLALLGGEPITRRSWPFFNTIGPAEKSEVMEVLNSGILSDFIASPGDRFIGGKKVRELEEAWTKQFGVPHAVSMNSCTSCLLAALMALGIGKDDEVIVPQLGMCAAATVVLLVGATPVFADCDPRSMLIDLQSVARLINSKTKAIIAVHLGGHPAPMDEIISLASENSIYVIEDNAQAPGSLYHDKWVGTIGHIGCFSLNCHKIIKCGEGGVACTHDSDLALRLQLVRNHGEKCLSGFGMEKERLMGLNLRMTELQAAVAIHQLSKLEDFNTKTIRLADYLTKRLNLPGLIPPPVAQGCTHVYYLYHWEYKVSEIGVPASIFAEAVQAEGLPVYANYGYLISRLPPFADRDMPMEEFPDDPRYPGACYCVENSLWTMMLSPHLSESDMDLLIAAITKVYNSRDQLK